jgi:hypothetical protein
VQLHKRYQSPERPYLPGTTKIDLLEPALQRTVNRIDDDYQNWQRISAGRYDVAMMKVYTHHFSFLAIRPKRSLETKKVPEPFHMDVLETLWGLVCRECTKLAEDGLHASLTLLRRLARDVFRSRLYPLCFLSSAVTTLDRAPKVMAELMETAAPALWYQHQQPTVWSLSDHPLIELDGSSADLKGHIPLQERERLLLQDIVSKMHAAIECKFQASQALLDSYAQTHGLLRFLWRHVRWPSERQLNGLDEHFLQGADPQHRLLLVKRSFSALYKVLLLSSK